MLELGDTILVVVDVQGKLADQMHDRDAFFENVRRLIKGATILGVPVVVTEQVPEKLGPTRPEIAEVLGDAPRFPKVAFSCWGEEDFAEALDDLDCSQILICGLEAHVCVHQTAVDLMDNEFEVHICADAVASRNPENKRVALERLVAEGAYLTSVEMALFELLVDADHRNFRDIIELVK